RHQREEPLLEAVLEDEVDHQARAAERDQEAEEHPERGLGPAGDDQPMEEGARREAGDPRAAPGDGPPPGVDRPGRPRRRRTRPSSRGSWVASAGGGGRAWMGTSARTASKPGRSRVAMVASVAAERRTGRGWPVRSAISP